LKIGIADFNNTKSFLQGKRTAAEDVLKSVSSNMYLDVETCL